MDTAPVPTPSGATGVVVQTGTTTTPDHQSPLVETLSGTGNEFYPIFSGIGTKVIRATHTTGIPTKISFINADGKSLEVAIRFPDASSGANLRWSQIVLPDGTMDGPFGMHTGYNLAQKWWYTLIFSENQMAGDRWSGEAEITLTLRSDTYAQPVIMLP